MLSCPHANASMLYGRPRKFPTMFPLEVNSCAVSIGPASIYYRCNPFLFV